MSDLPHYLVEAVLRGLSRLLIWIPDSRLEAMPIAWAWLAGVCLTAAIGSLGLAARTTLAWPFPTFVGPASRRSARSVWELAAPGKPEALPRDRRITRFGMGRAPDTPEGA